MRGTPRPPMADLALAVLLTLVTQLEIWAGGVMPAVDPPEVSPALLSVLTLPITVPLAWRRVVPLGVLVPVLGAACLQALVTVPNEGLGTMLAQLVAVYSVSAHGSRRSAGIGALLLLPTALVVGEGGDQVFVAVLLGAALLGGLVVARGADDIALLADHNRDLATQLATATRLIEEARAPLPAPERLGALTARELEVVRAVATGRSNAEIAQLLVISEWTVKTHVASILRKLGLRDRAQVVVAAYESGLVRPGTGARPGEPTVG